MNALALDLVWLGCGALFGARGRVVMNRLTLHPVPDAPAQLAAPVLELLEEQWPEARGPLCLSPTTESLLSGLLEAERPAHTVLEVPAFLAGDPAWEARLRARAAAGQALALKGRPLQPLSPELLTCFRHVIVDMDDDRRQTQAPASGAARQTPWVQAGTTTPEQAGVSLRRGALAVLGWPLGERPGPDAPRKDVPPSVQIVMDPIQRVDREEPVNRLEEALRGDPTLAFRLMRLINSPAFGLSVEISSFQHAIMVLGYQRLKRWLALLVTNAVDNPDLQPLMQLAVRRGLLMEELVRAQGDSGAAGEAFICGVFSLLDRMLGQPFDRLLGNLPVGEGVAQTLAPAGQGPYSLALAVARAVESELPLDIAEAAGAMLLSPGELNRAALKAMLAAQQLQGD